MNRTGCHVCHGRLPLCEACVASQVEAIHVAHLAAGLDGANCPRCQSAKHHSRRDRRRSLGRRA